MSVLRSLGARLRRCGARRALFGGLVGGSLLVAACHDAPAPADDRAAASARAPVAAPSAASCTATVLGALVGAPLVVRDCVSHVETAAGLITTDVVLADYAPLCSSATGGAVRHDSRVLDVHFATNSPLTAGVYPAAGGAVSVQLAAFDGTCSATAGAAATSGTVTITAADAAHVAGSFDVAMGDDHASGTFDAPRCSADAVDGGPSCI